MEKQDMDGMETESEAETKQDVKNKWRSPGGQQIWE